MKKKKAAQRKNQPRWDTKINNWVWLTVEEAAAWDVKEGQKTARAFAAALAMG